MCAVYDSLRRSADALCSSFVTEVTVITQK